MTALKLAKEIGFPVLLKATAGGGGKGMRGSIQGQRASSRTTARRRSEAEKAFGNAGLYLEKYIVDGRHIEFQIMADAFGKVVHLGERECSAQRRHQKLVEESPSPVMDARPPQRSGREAPRARCGRSATATPARSSSSAIPRRAALLHGGERALQVEHPVTEQVTGRDLVAEQIRIAANEPLFFGQDEVELRATPSSAGSTRRIPFDDFKPSPGEVTKFAPPTEIPRA